MLSVYANESKADVETTPVASEQDVQNNDVSEEEGEDLPEDYIDVTGDGVGEMTDEQAERMDQFIEEYGKHLNFSEDGIDTSDVNTEKLEDKYGEDVVEMMDAGIEAINEKVEEDEYAVTDNGTIYETDDEDMTVQGKYNKNKGTTYYWGRKIYQSYSNANKHKKSLRKCSTAAGLIGDACTLCGGFNSKKIFLESLAALGIRAYSDKFANSIAKYNKKSYGIKYKIVWAMAYTMRTQNQKW